MGSFVCKKQKQILSKLKSKYWEHIHKFGIYIPKTIQEAIAINKENGNRSWQDIIAEEMAKVRVAFELYEDSLQKLVGYKNLNIHMVFDIHMGNILEKKQV